MDFKNWSEQRKSSEGEGANSAPKTVLETQAKAGENVAEKARNVEPNNPSKQTDNSAGKNVSVAGDLAGKMNAYRGMSEDALTEELLRETAKARANGSFSETELNNFVSSVAPALNEEQRNKLNNVLKLLK